LRHSTVTTVEGAIISAAGRETGADRLDTLHAWVATQLGQQAGGDAGDAGDVDNAAFLLAPASNDASFRRYFRITPAAGAAALPGRAAASLIVMDAPPDKEDCHPFVQVAGLFGSTGVHVPAVLAQDFAQGFLLLSDLGNTTYLAAMQSDPASADRLYREALTALVAIQRGSRPGELPAYDRALLERELMLFPEWYVEKQLGRTLSDKQAQVLRRAFDLILENNLAQPQVYVHRDYHSRNLMVTTPNPGILDFQDAVYGPITYDLVSLLRDAYIAWDEQQVLDWCIRYWEAARAAGLPVHADFGQFYWDFEWMGAQRQLKVLGIFARLAHRDGKHGYLADQPLVMSYLKKTCQRYRELGPLADLLDELQPVEKLTGYTF
jgi:aminoglycoside/choline kinase family phosphotransferase